MFDALDAGGETSKAGRSHRSRTGQRNKGRGGECVCTLAEMAGRLRDGAQRVFAVVDATSLGVIGTRLWNPREDRSAE